MQRFLSASFRHFSASSPIYFLKSDAAFRSLCRESETFHFPADEEKGAGFSSLAGRATVPPRRRMWFLKESTSRAFAVGVDAYQSLLSIAPIPGPLRGLAPNAQNEAAEEFSSGLAHAPSIFVRKRNEE
jgi:hypothetical protein